jgi:hypothetical protein
VPGAPRWSTIRKKNSNRELFFTDIIASMPRRTGKHEELVLLTQSPRINGPWGRFSDCSPVWIVSSIGLYCVPINHSNCWWKKTKVRNFSDWQQCLLSNIFIYSHSFSYRSTVTKRINPCFTETTPGRPSRTGLQVSKLDSNFSVVWIFAWYHRELYRIYI